MELQNKRKNNFSEYPISYIGGYFLCPDNLSYKYKLTNCLCGVLVKHHLCLYYYVETSYTHLYSIAFLISKNYTNLHKDRKRVQNMFLLQTTEKSILSNEQNKAVFIHKYHNICYIIQNSLNYSGTRPINHNYIYGLTVSVRKIENKQPVLFNVKTPIYNMKETLDITALN